MGTSRHTTLVLTCAAVLCTVVPGTLGYTTARLEAMERAAQQLRMLQARLQSDQVQISGPWPTHAPCPPPADLQAAERRAPMAVRGRSAPHGSG